MKWNLLEHGTIEVQQLACALGEATPTEQERSCWLRVRPQRLILITKLMLQSDFLERWSIKDLRIGNKQPEGWGPMLPLPAEVFSPRAFGTRLALRVDVHEEFSLLLSWAGRIERFPAFLNRQRAWRPCYRNAWWVTRSRPRAMTIRGVALGAC